MYDIAIIGAGPAGASAAIFAAKAGKKTVVIDQDKGMTRRAWLENMYGLPEISGPDLVDTGIRQFTKFGATHIVDHAHHIEQNEQGFIISTDSNGEIHAKHVILATGVSPDLAQNIGVQTLPGTEPRIKTILQVDEQGKTNINGIWAAGTCAGVSVHAIITAGDGAKVAINVISELNGERYVDHDMMPAK